MMYISFHLSMCRSAPQSVLIWYEGGTLGTDTLCSTKSCFITMEYHGWSNIHILQRIKERATEVNCREQGPRIRSLETRMTILLLCILVLLCISLDLEPLILPVLYGVCN